MYICPNCRKVTEYNDGKCSSCSKTMFPKASVVKKVLVRVLALTMLLFAGVYLFGCIEV